MDRDEELLRLASAIIEEGAPYPFVLDLAALALGRLQLYGRRRHLEASRERLHLAVEGALRDRAGSPVALKTD